MASSHPKKIWILVANASSANVYQTSHLGGQLELVEQFSHPQSREKVRDLVDGRPGAGMPGSQLEPLAPRTDPKAVEEEKFARELAKKLNNARTQNKFTQLILIASPHFLGDINRFSDKNLTECVLHQVDKDYSHLTIPDLQNKIAELPRYVD